MTTERPTVYVPVARFVSGSLTEKRTTDHQNRPIEADKQRFEFGVALRKDSPQVNEFWQQLINGAKQCYAHDPRTQGLIDQWLQNGFNGFSMKVSDGDQPSQRTQQVNENTAGCWVVWFSTSMPVTTYDSSNAPIDPSKIERGYYVDVLASIAANNLPLPQTGIYMNPDMVRLQFIGDVIRGGPDPMAALAKMPTAPGAPPPGARPVGAPPAQASAPMPGMGPAGAAPTMPQAPTPPGVPQMPGVPGQTAPAMPGVPQQYGTASPTSPPVPPYPGVLNS